MIAFVSAILTISFYIFHQLEIDWHLVIFNYNATFILYHLDNLFDSSPIYQQNHPKRFSWQQKNLPLLSLHMLTSIISCLYIFINDFTKQTILVLIIAISFYIIYRFLLKINKYLLIIIRALIVCISWLTMTALIPYVNYQSHLSIGVYLLTFFSLILINYFFCNAIDFGQDKLINRLNILDLLNQKQLITINHLITFTTIAILICCTIPFSTSAIIALLAMNFFGKKCLEKKKSNLTLDLILILPLFYYLLATTLF